MRRVTLVSGLLLASLLLSLLVFLTACASTQPKSSPVYTSVKVSGTPGTLFNFRYVWAGHAGELSTVVWNEPVEVMRFDGDRLEECTLEKGNFRGELVLEVYRSSQRELLAVIPVGRRGVNAKRGEGNRWQYGWY